MPITWPGGWLCGKRGSEAAGGLVFGYVAGGGCGSLLRDLVPFCVSCGLFCPVLSPLWLLPKLMRPHAVMPTTRLDLRTWPFPNFVLTLVSTAVFRVLCMKTEKEKDTRGQMKKKADILFVRPTSRVGGRFRAANVVRVFLALWSQSWSSSLRNTCPLGVGRCLCGCPKTAPQLA